KFPGTHMCVHRECRIGNTIRVMPALTIPSETDEKVALRCATSSAPVVGSVSRVAWADLFWYCPSQGCRDQVAGTLCSPAFSKGVRGIPNRRRLREVGLQ